MFKGEDYSMEVTVAPKGASVAYSVEPEGVVSVDSAGKLTALSVGNAVVTASIGDSTDSVTVTVSEAEEEEEI